MTPHPRTFRVATLAIALLVAAYGELFDPNRNGPAD